MRLFATTSIMIVMASPVITTFTAFENVNILANTKTSQTYCASRNGSIANGINTSEQSVCSSISPSFSVAAANATSGECSCHTWSLENTNAVACNCNPCAPLFVDNFDRTCASLIRKCMIGEGTYDGAYLTKSGEGYFGYLTVYTDGGFGRTSMPVSCPESVDDDNVNTTTTAPTANETSNDNFDVEVLGLPSPTEMPEVVTELSNLGFTSAEIFPDHVRTDEETKALLDKIETTQAELKAIQANLDKQQAEQEEKEAVEAERLQKAEEAEQARKEAAEAARIQKAEAEQEKKDAAEAKKIQNAEDKKIATEKKQKAAEAKKAQKAEDKKTAAEKKQKTADYVKAQKANHRKFIADEKARTKAAKAMCKQYGCHHGLTDREWIDKIRAEHSQGLYPFSRSWLFVRPIWKALCKVDGGACVMVSRHDGGISPL